VRGIPVEQVEPFVIPAYFYQQNGQLLLKKLGDLVTFIYQLRSGFLRESDKALILVFRDAP